MAGPVMEFVVGWNVVQTLGEGAFGEVKLLINTDTGEAVAMKMVDLVKHPDAGDAVRKEICVHRMLKHANIVKFYGSRRENAMQYMFLEYAAGGELFDRIEPDVGMPPHEAQKYFKELVSGVEYLHGRGVTHRDLKPENLLLDENDHLKITDFGMATLFRHQGKERELDRRCGTKPYMAPEVLLRPYNAEPADIWSCGVILVALLAGELPWDEPTFSCPEYTSWKDKDCHLFTTTPWTKIDNLALSLLRKVLNTVPRHRATIAQITGHQWVNKNFFKSSGMRIGETMTPNTKRICSEFDRANSAGFDVSMRLACSQPEAPTDTVLEPVSAVNINVGMLSFSQPAQPDQLLLSQMTQGTQASQTPLQRLVKRMTRVLVRTSLGDTITHLEALFSKLKYTHRCHTANVVVEIDESKFGRRKYQVGRIVDGHWMLGRVERGSNKSFLITVPNCSRRTLIPLIQEWVLPGTKIMTDCWKAYSSLKDLGYDHTAVNHSRNFVDPVSGAHTQTVERLWREVKAHVPRFGRKCSNFDAYLSKAQFIRGFKDTFVRYHQFLLLAGMLYPPAY